MPYFARLLVRNSRRRAAPARYHLERLEDRTALSTTAAVPAVATSITLQSSTPQPMAISAETGQHVPLVATIESVGTAPVNKSGKTIAIQGTVEFYINSPTPVILGTVKVNNRDFASLDTDKLITVGPDQIVAQFVPSNDVYAASTSAPLPVTITPKTLNAPTVTTLALTASTFETGQLVSLNATVQNSDSSLPDGTIELRTVSRHPVALGAVAANEFGEQVSFGTYKLDKVGIYHVQAEYVPDSNLFAKSVSAPLTVLVTPLTAASFRVTPLVSHGKLNKPLSFKVTALNVHRQPLTDYTGTVILISPTDSSTVYPPGFYTSLHISASPSQTTGLAIFNPQSYTFTSADDGSHTFYGGVKFGKAGAENIKVIQADDLKVVGKTTFAIK